MTSENKGAAAEPAKVHTPDQIRKLEQSILELVRLVGPTSSVESYEGCPNTELRYTHTFQLKNDPPESPHSSGRVAKLMLYRTAITKSGNRLNIGPKVFWRIGGYTYGLALEYMEKAWSIKACEKRIKDYTDTMLHGEPATIIEQGPEAETIWTLRIVPANRTDFTICEITGSGRLKTYLKLEEMVHLTLKTEVQERGHK